MRLRTKPIQTDKPKPNRKNTGNIKVHPKRILIAIPSWTGVIDSQAVDGFMRLIGNISNLKEKFEVFTTMPIRMPVVTARNLVIVTALENKCDYILWIDDDMVVKPNVNLVERLLTHDKDIVAPLFFSRTYPFIPMIFTRRTIGTKFTVYDNIVDYKKGLIEVDGIGFGCILTKVDIFKKLAKPHFWANDIFGEDLYFCENATRAGIKIYCDTTIDVGHIGEPVVSWEASHLQAKQANYDYLKQKAVKDSEIAKKFYEDIKWNTDKKVSIILTSYNKPQYLRLAIDSVLAQSYPNFELLIMDDNSQKEVRDIILSYKDDRIRTFFSDVKEADRFKKVRYSSLINSALGFATGDYISYMTDDDIYSPNRLEVMVNALNANPNIMIVYSGQNQVKDDKVKKQFIGLPPLRVVGVTDNIAFKADHNSVMHRKDIADGIKWEENVKAWRWADAYFFTELSKKGIKFYPIDMQLDVNIQHDMQISRDIEFQTGHYPIDRSKIELP